MNVQIFVNNPWQQNTVLLFDETKSAVVVDCGCYTKNEEEYFEKYIKDNHLELKYLLSTHLHIDHVLGNGFIDRTYNIKGLASKDDQFILDNSVEYAAMLGLSGVERPPQLGGYLQDGDMVSFGNTELRVIAVAGHSPGGLCFYSEKDRLLIAGDVLFAGSIGRADLPGGDYNRLISDIREKLFTLPDDVVVIPGHGPRTTIGREKLNNPFFK